MLPAFSLQLTSIPTNSDFLQPFDKLMDKLRGNRREDFKISHVISGSSHGPTPIHASFLSIKILTFWS